MESKMLDQLRVLLEKSNTLYDSTDIEDTDKIKLLATIEDLEEKIRGEEFKIRLITGEE